MSSNCFKCLDLVSDGVHCQHCKSDHHFECAGIRESVFRKWDGDKKKAWRCSRCRASPVREGNKQVEEISLSTILHELRETRNDLKHEITQVKNDVRNVNEKLAEFDQRLQNLESLKSGHDELVERVQEMSSTITQLRSQLSQKEQRDRINNLEIAGIPLQKSENLNCILQMICTKVGFSLLPGDVDTIHRVRRFTNSTSVFRGDRNASASGLSRGGGVAVAVRGALRPELRHDLAAPAPADELYNATGTSPYKYFTQLVWADSYQVGCGGVKFKERLDDSDYKKNRTVYRLVCNFAPRGNQVGKAVYTAGPTGSKCIYGTNKNHTSLCDTKPAVDDDIDELVDEPKNLNFTGDISDTDTTVEHNSTLNTEALAITDLNEDDNTTFDYFSHLYQLTKDYLTSTTTTKAMCNKELAVDEIVEFLKKKLSSDPTLQQLFTTTLPISTGSVFRDASVVAFLDKIYSKAVLTTTTETPNADFVNSTLLVNLVEAVIFRNTVPVQAEMVPVKQNYDVTGHYFFPEDDIEEAAKETTEPDYDMSYAPSMQDVVHEIEELRKNKPTRDFLYDILETESAVESTTKFKLLSPDDMNLHTSGYSNMKIFLKEIADKSENHNAEHLISA
ncbi:hypothetical protein MSG28_002762 [Choristoneura fumiferana]|uniref:Uncharacterized protein n=1 Tax=Choristoneura fumiferana TaxID=7141 RepID=A0ACC0JJ88_CHOFU|nr:hypothetical protein MSG28_002762 [Choristoneura fumiferana]